MSRKKHHGGPAPIPAGNRSGAGPVAEQPKAAAVNPENAPQTGAPFEEQDPKRRLGDFGGKGEHPRMTPGRTGKKR